ncbi:hypothetical protein [Agromyces sp. NPDC058104]|uniref:hypothetical protein n=1 Tax=Agromyces sp. NPDC058104 TaxID=3346342 RepID=UPI0036DC241E
MTDEKIVPEGVKLAAKRGFVRTTAQAYAATLATGIPTAAAVVQLVNDPAGWLLAGVTVGLAIVTPVLAGGAAYLSILSKGIPEAYADASIAGLAELDAVGRNAEIAAAWSKLH